MKTEEKKEKMRFLEKKLKKLTNSPLYDERVTSNYHYVFGEGDLNSKIMLIGEAPGKNEALSGKPFCGSSGKFLDQLLNHIQINRESVYITNIVKDRPPENRDPTSKEIEIYAPFLEAQINIIKPKVIASLGRYASDYIQKRLLNKKTPETITSLHGKKMKVNLSFGDVTVVPLYHPAVAIYNATKKDELKKDFEVLKDFK